MTRWCIWWRHPLALQALTFQQGTGDDPVVEYSCEAVRRAPGAVVRGWTCFSPNLVDFMSASPSRFVVVDVVTFLDPLAALQPSLATRSLFLTCAENKTIRRKLEPGYPRRSLRMALIIHPAPVCVSAFAHTRLCDNAVPRACSAGGTNSGWELSHSTGATENILKST